MTTATGWLPADDNTIVRLSTNAPVRLGENGPVVGTVTDIERLDRGGIGVTMVLHDRAALKLLQGPLVVHLGDDGTDVQP